MNGKRDQFQFSVLETKKKKYTHIEITQKKLLGSVGPHVNWATLLGTLLSALVKVTFDYTQRDRERERGQ